MQFKQLLVTGGAGFVGANLAVQLKRNNPDLVVVALDNLKRRGSELNLPRLRKGGVEFFHGDIRCREDLESLPTFDLLIDCAAEPSVQAGVGTSPRYVLETNLCATINCIEEARRRRAAFMLLSTSRVYPIGPLNQLPFVEEESRFRWEHEQASLGFSEQGVSEAFPLEGPRSFYGSAKLASETLIQEYVHAYGIPAIINRCGLLAGPWQMGKVDQGVVALWVARHYFQQPLSYIGFGGTGKQVRDVLYIDDLVRLIELQTQSPEKWDGSVYNVGGGMQHSVSLLELSAICQAETGQKLEISQSAETSSVDLRIYVTDNQKVNRDFDWSPTCSVEETVREIHGWIEAHHRELRDVLG